MTQELHKQGTPEYDPRSHERAIEAERKAQDASTPRAASALKTHVRLRRALVSRADAGRRTRRARGPESMYLDVR